MCKLEMWVLFTLVGFKNITQNPERDSWKRTSAPQICKLTKALAPPAAVFQISKSMCFSRVETGKVLSVQHWKHEEHILASQNICLSQDSTVLSIDSEEDIPGKLSIFLLQNLLGNSEDLLVGFNGYPFPPGWFFGSTPAACRIQGTRPPRGTQDISVFTIDSMRKSLGEWLWWTLNILWSMGTLNIMVILWDIHGQFTTNPFRSGQHFFSIPAVQVLIWTVRRSRIWQWPNQQLLKTDV